MIYQNFDDSNCLEYSIGVTCKQQKGNVDLTKIINGILSWKEYQYYRIKAYSIELLAESNIGFSIEFYIGTPLNIVEDVNEKLVELVIDNNLSLVPACPI